MEPVDVITHNGGKMIALEGDCDNISTQLHLLPPSSQIMIFPPFPKIKSKPDAQSNFDARKFIRDVHTVYTERMDAAQYFLENTSTSDPKLVFLNGGSLRARTVCIEGICENVTSGQIGAAEVLFNEITKDGVAALWRKDELLDDKTIQNLTDGHVKNQARLSFQWNEKEYPEENASHKKMKRISMDQYSTFKHALDNLVQSSEQSTARSLRDEQTPRHSMSAVSAYASNISKKWAFETPPNDDTVFIAVSSFSKSATHSKDAHGDLNFIDPTIPTNRFSMLPSQSLNDDSVSITLDSSNFEGVVPRSKSFELDRNSRPNYNFLQTPKSDVTPQTRNQVLSCPQVGNHDSSLSEVSISAFLKAYQTTILRNPINVDSELNPENNVVDQESVMMAEPEPQPPTPAFDLVEDFVIHFIGGMTDVIFDAVIRSYQNSRNPAHPGPMCLNSSPTTPLRASFFGCITPKKDSSFTRADDLSSIDERRSFDPYAVRNYPLNMNPNRPPPPAKDNIPTTSVSSQEAKFLTFSPAYSRNPVDVHNAFRQLLSRHFPAGKGGYSQYPNFHSADRLWKPIFGNLDISEGFGVKQSHVDQIIALACDDDVETILSKRISGMIERLGTKKDGESRGSRLEISYLIANLLQNKYSLPSKSNHFDPLSNPSLTATLLIPQLESYFASNPSTRFLVLHFQPFYLPIVLALRDLIGTPLLKVAGITSNLLTETTLNSYPPLPLSPNPLSNDAVASRNRTRCNSARTSMVSGRVNGNIRTLLSKIPLISSSSSTVILAPSIAQSDYILPTSATDAEVSTFISSMLKTLLEKSDFYTPEPEPEPKTIVQVVEKYLTAPTPALSFATTHSRPSSQRCSSTRDEPLTQEGYFSPKNKRLSKLSHITGQTSISRSFSEFRAKHAYAPSIASSRHTFVSKLSEDGDKWENFEIGDDDSDFDDFDRMIMGRKMATVFSGGHILGTLHGEKSIKERGAASKRKALKWLGLA